MPSVNIGGISFASKVEAESHIRNILGRYNNMQPVIGADLAFVNAVLDLHPNRETIVGEGLRRIVVQHLKDHYKSRRFLGVRMDHTLRDFTWRTALYPKSARARLMKACRWAVRDQIQQFREKAFATIPSQDCAISGKPITLTDSDVDHIPPRTFEALVEAWLRLNRLEAENIGLVPQSGYEQPDRWEDDFLEENWREYHRTHCHLRVIHPFANRSIVRKSANVG